jgi:hypothetical protein
MGSEEIPGDIQHGVRTQIHVDGQELVRILFGEGHGSFIVFGEVESVVLLGLGFGGVGIQPNRGIHHLAVVAAGFLADDLLFESGQRTEGIHDDFTDIGIGSQEKLPLGDGSPCCPVSHG